MQVIDERYTTRLPPPSKDESVVLYKVAFSALLNKLNTIDNEAILSLPPTVNPEIRLVSAEKLDYI